MNQQKPETSVTANRRRFATVTHSRPTIKEDNNLKTLSQKVFLSSGLLLLSLSSFLPKAGAQIVPDATLPGNSTVTPQGNTSVIEGGTSAGTNLFHSFREFSIPTNGTAFFNNAADIQNILTRVTGGSLSNIDGLIQANGTANLFLINPNGIIFGPNAALNIGGSFLASTANQINFADGTQFSATSPQTTPLLTVSVPVGLQMGPNPGNIVVQGSYNNLSVDPETFATIRDNPPVGLQVAAGQTLALLGGNLALEGGKLTAEGGRVELGSVGGETLVTLTPMNQGMALSYPGIENFQDISLSMGASVDASSAAGRDVFVTGRRVTVTDGSSIVALTESSAPSGTLSVRASEVVEVIGTSTDGESSSLFASVNEGATGEGGNLTIEAPRLQIIDGAYVGTSTSGGKTGNLTIQASDTVEVIGTSTDGESSSLGASVSEGATGEGGNLTIETPRLRIIDGAYVGTSTSGGKTGNLTIQASDTVEVIGTSTDGESSSLGASVDEGATGEGGNLTIETPRLRIIDGAYVGTSTSGPRAGNLSVQASDTVEVIGTSTNGKSSTLGASVNEEARGEGGNLTIETPRLRIVDGAYVGTNTSGPGKAGNLTVKASDTVEVIGTSTDGESSNLETSGNEGAAGEGGNLTIETPRLRIINGAYVGTSTSGPDKAGNLSVKASDTVEVIGTSADGHSSSVLDASANKGATGEGGNLTIETARLRIINGAYVGTSTSGPGKAGNLNIQASDTVEVIGTSADGDSSSALSASANEGATGEGGNLTIETPRLRIVDGAYVGTNTSGPGKAGNLSVQASDTVEVIGTSADGQRRSGLDTETEVGAIGEGGNLTIETARLRVVDGGYVATGTSGPGKAGNLSVQASDTVEVIGTSADGSRPSGLDASVKPEATGEGGNLTIETARLRVADGAIATVSSRGEGKAGNLIVDAGSIGLSNTSSLTAETSAGGGTIELDSDTITLGGGSSITTNAQGGESGGNIDVRSSALILRQGSRITTNATGSQVTGGNLTVNTNVIAAIENSDISANSEDARGGNITINAQAIFGSVFRTPEDLERLLNTSDPLLLDPARLPSSDITATGADLSLSGTVSVNTPNVDPAQGLLNLPEIPVDATQLVASTCRRGKNQSEFTVTGRGGLPPNPYEAIADEATWIDLRPIARERANSGTEEQTTIAGNRQDSTTSPVQLIEAQGWVINSKGQVELVTQVPGVAPQTSQFIPQQCHE
ncbi:filamentous hemagglutinin N-terminal domain-containing protein [Microcoleus sp. FACHB-672]|uniref:two-partner secretion domain-containing protein n=1 Tax=Microcoleus sp. FACHB-672 TaxID=2692825 RepID=UPI001685AED6|nr:filamentous hemagglutinin N-terminal domain-containing protein [Microcoleus sp. FACHB-672]MBD2041065.1 filamentous hemagglutinin N-terminal domain-containing protein [Microcoleus sp. FACHB-672]